MSLTSMIAAVAATIASYAVNVPAAHQLDARQTTCLAEAVYYESRGEPVMGQFMVASVILHRVAQRDGSARDICRVIREPGQFQSSRRLGNPVREPEAFMEAVRVSVEAQIGWTPQVPFRPMFFFNPTTATHAWTRRTSGPSLRVGKHVFLAALTPERRNR